MNQQPRNRRHLFAIGLMCVTISAAILLTGCAFVPSGQHNASSDSSWFPADGSPGSSASPVQDSLPDSTERPLLTRDQALESIHGLLETFGKAETLVLKPLFSAESSGLGRCRSRYSEENEPYPNRNGTFGITVSGIHGTGGISYGYGGAGIGMISGKVTVAWNDSKNGLYISVSDMKKNGSANSGSDCAVFIPSDPDGIHEFFFSNHSVAVLIECSGPSFFSIPSDRHYIAFWRTNAWLSSFRIPEDFRREDSRLYSSLRDFHTLVDAFMSGFFPEFSFCSFELSLPAPLPSPEGSGNGPFSEQPPATEGLIYTPVENGYAVTGFTSLLFSSKPDSLVIPDTYEGLPVVAVDKSVLTVLKYADDRKLYLPGSIGKVPDSFAWGNYISHLYLGEGITEIGASAFAECGLKSVSLPTTLETIGVSAFASNYDLTEVVIRGSRTEIGDWAFRACHFLSRVVFSANGASASLGKRCFGDCYSLVSLDLSAVSIREISDESFAGCLALTDFKFPDGLHSIGANAFSGTGLSDPVIPEGVEDVSPSAFSGCKDLVSIGIPASLRYNGESSWEIRESGNFRGFVVATSSTVFRSDTNCLITSGGVLICGCPVDPIVPEGTKIINSFAFGSMPVAEIMLPSSLETIGKYAFDGCGELRSVRLAAGSRLRELDDYAFRNCVSLTEFNGLSDSLVERIGNGTFAGCQSIIELSLPATLKYLNSAALVFCERLERISFAGRMKDFKAACAASDWFPGADGRYKLTVMGVQYYLPAVICSDGSI